VYCSRYISWDSLENMSVIFSDMENYLGYSQSGKGWVVPRQV